MAPLLLPELRLVGGLPELLPLLLLALPVPLLLVPPLLVVPLLLPPLLPPELLGVPLSALFAIEIVCPPHPGPPKTEAAARSTAKHVTFDVTFDQAAFIARGGGPSRGPPPQSPCPEEEGVLRGILGVRVWRSVPRPDAAVMLYARKAVKGAATADGTSERDGTPAEGGAVEGHSGLHAAIAWLRKRPDVRYAEARFMDDTSERFRVRDGRPEQVTTGGSRGVGIRVLGAKAWGFACTPHVTESALIEAAGRAVAIARASGLVAHGAIAFPERPAARGFDETAVAIAPITVPIETKLAALDAPMRALRTGDPHLVSAEAWMHWTRQTKRLLTTEGTDVAQSFTYGACGMHVIALGDDGVSQRRSHPTWQGGDGFQAGWERIAALDLTTHVDRTKEEALALLTAPPCPGGTRTLLLESSQLALQIHESCGHPTELDRALGSEISLAGGSFLQPSMLGKLRYGSPLVTLVADSTIPAGNGTFGWDDEGTPAGKRPLVDRGLFVDYLSSRETAAALGRSSTGTMRADSWNRTPIIRMVNVSLEPGSAGSLEDLVADTDDGILVATDKSWSIDDIRLNFQFSCEIAWEIKRGRRVRLLRNPFYTGITPRFWNACDAVCGPEAWDLWGITSCGKGDPMQVMHVGHGAAPARFRDVTVGSAS